MARILETECWNGTYIQNGVMRIRWDSGQMNINIAWFFPCGRATWNKLLKTMKLDWENYPKMVPDLEAWMMETIKEADYWIKAYGNKYAEKHQKACDLKHMIEDKKYPNGVPISKDKIKELKKDYRNATTAERDALKQATDFRKLKERLKEQIERDIKPCKLDI